jgi:hypothetical protein
MTGCLVDVVAVMGDVFILVYNFHVPLALKVGCPSSGAGCDIVLVFIFLCIGLRLFVVVLQLSPVFFLFVCILLCLSRGGPPLWSSGQSSWLQIRRFRARFPGTTKKSSGSGMGSTQPRE